ncbi:MAG TPA: class III signal peptide-containing protein [Candidatus Avelusimicrobium excrementipullorum]|nr:class III signal peptide-containing protein [Candidatus Avelusimicrobium excrementipullorum]
MRKIKAAFCRARQNRRGQASIEYVLMLGSIMVILSAFITAFHKDIVRWFFMFVGQLLTQ